MKRAILLLALLTLAGCECRWGENIKGVVDAKLISAHRSTHTDHASRQLRIKTDDGFKVVCCTETIWERTKVGALWDNGALVVEQANNLEGSPK